MQRCVDEQNHVVDNPSAPTARPTAATPRRSRRLHPRPHASATTTEAGEASASAAWSVGGGELSIPSPARSYINSSGRTLAEASAAPSPRAAALQRTRWRRRRIMQRIPLTPREDWQQKVESAGLTFHTLEVEQKRRPLLGRVRRLPVHRRRDRHPRSRRQHPAGDVPRRRPAHHRREALRRTRHPRRSHPRHRVGLEQRASRPLRTLRPKLGRSPERPRPQAPRVQRRHPHLAPRSRRHPVGLAEGCRNLALLALETRPVQLHPRKTHRQMEGHQTRTSHQAHLLPPRSTAPKTS